MKIDTDFAESLIDSPDEINEKKEREEGYHNFVSFGKVKINEVLFELLPPEITLREADDLASYIYGLIFSKWDKPVPSPSEEE